MMTPEERTKMLFAFLEAYPSDKEWHLVTGEDLDEDWVMVPSPPTDEEKGHDLEKTLLADIDAGTA